MKGRIIYPDDEKPWIQITSAKIIFPKIIFPKPRKSSKVKSMNRVKTATIVAVSVFTILAVAMIMSFQFTEIIAEEQAKTGFTFSGNITTTAVFKFSEGEELIPIEAFTQTKGFQRADPFIFVMQKITGDTPLLHMHADEAFLYRNSEIQKQDYNPFDVDIIISNGGDLKRVFTYTQCFVDDYNVATLRDNEEGYMNKGFAVVENYIIECSSYHPRNPALEEIMTTKPNQKANTTSTMDLKESTKTWRDYYEN
jgi:nitrate reductase NapE component